MRFTIKMVDDEHKRIGIPAVLDAPSIDVALSDFIKRDAGQELRSGLLLEIMGEDRKKHHYLYSDHGKLQWIPTWN